MRYAILTLALLACDADTDNSQAEPMGAAGAPAPAAAGDDDAQYICQVAADCGAVADVDACASEVRATETTAAITACADCYESTLDLTCDDSAAACEGSCS